MTHPKISVLLPTYNRPEYIVLAMRSVLAQDFPWFELLILDDSTNNHTTRVVCALTDSRIVYVKNKKNLGYAANLKQGFRLSHGTYVFILSDDDLILRTDTFSTIYREMEKRSAGYGQTGLVYYDRDYHKPSVLDHVATRLIYMPPSRDVLMKTLSWHYGFMSGNIFRKDSMRIEEDLHDTDIWWPYLPAAYRAMRTHGGIYFGRHFVIARTSTTGLIAWLDVEKNGGFYMDRLFTIFKQFDTDENHQKLFIKNRLDIVVKTLPGIKYYTSNKNIRAMVAAIIAIRPVYIFERSFWVHYLVAYYTPTILLRFIRPIRTLYGYLRLKKLLKDIRLAYYLKKTVDN